MTFRQADWHEPLIFECSTPGKRGHLVPEPEPEEVSSAGDLERLVPPQLRRKAPPALPEVSEVEVVRHFTRLSQQNFGVDLGIYPLGSCTMKYTPKITNKLASSPKLQALHPYQNTDLAQGILQILFELGNFLAEITGMDKVSLQPAAGAQGEFTGVLIIRAYHKLHGELERRNEIIVPDSAHGTNPASAAMAGFKTVVVPSGPGGTVDLEALRAAISGRTAGLMITNPNTLGLFEKDILTIARLVHDGGGLLYYDGANLNAILGKVRPGDMGFDIAHINLHKTFSAPHGGGGPGAGPVCVKKELEEFLPVPTIGHDGKRFYLDYGKKNSVGKVGSFYGNTAVLLRAYTYILLMGAEGLEKVAELAVLNSNYVARRIAEARGLSLPYSTSTPRKHEAVVSAEKMYQETGVRALDVAKRLLDYGAHAPTNYFPLIVPEALMIEPTETECKEELDRLVSAFTRISEEAYTAPDRVQNAPSHTTVTRIDDVKASHPKTLCLSWRMERERH